MADVLVPEILNLTMTSADTEYSQALPLNCKYVSIQTRDGTAARIAFVTGKVAASTAPFFTIRANSAYNVPESINPCLTPGTALTVYAACASASKILEIVCWKLPTAPTFT